MNFGHFRAAITPSLGWVRGSSWYGLKYIGEIFLTKSSLHIFDMIWGRHAYRKLGCWIEEGPNQDIKNGKLFFWPINLLFHLRDLFWVKISFSQIRKPNFTHRAWRREKRIRNKNQGFSKNSKELQVKLVGGDPYQDVWVLLCWVNSYI